MASTKPPDNSQPTSPSAYDQYVGHVREPVPPSTAENGVEILQTEGNQPVLSTPRVHPVNFEVANCSNAGNFFTELLQNILLVDSTASLLPHPDAPAESRPCESVIEIPKDVESLKSFVLHYFSGLHATKTHMKGKFWFMTKYTLPTFKKNPTFGVWLSGSKTAMRTQLDRTDLPGNTRFSVGMFFNVIARPDLESNFTERTARILLDTCQARPAPAFQIEAKPIFHKSVRAKVYRMLASSKDDAITLKEMMAVIMPAPTTAVSFIPYSVWETLPATKKKAYFDMQASFSSDHNALLFRGVKDPSLLLPGTIVQNSIVGQAPCPAKSILQWISSQTTSERRPLFSNVWPSLSGDIEIWHHRRNDAEARAWLKTALSQIASLSGIDIDTNPELATAMFTFPDGVWKAKEANFLGRPLLDERKCYLDFSPPTRTSGGAITTTATTTRQKKAPQRPRKLEIVFDLEEVSSAISEDVKSTASKRSRKAKRSSNKKGQSGTASVSSRQSSNSKKAKARAAAATAANAAATAAAATAIDPTAAAASAAAKKTADEAHSVAMTALKQYPAGSPTLDVGEYYTILDNHGNKLPVVYISNVAIPMTTESLRKSWGDLPFTPFGSIERVPQSPARMQPASATPLSRPEVSRPAMAPDIASAATKHTAPPPNQAEATISSATWRAPLDKPSPPAKKWGDQDSASTNRSAAMDTSPYDSMGPNHLSGFSDTDSKDYRDNNDFDEDAMTDVSDNTADNRTVCSANGSVTWAARLTVAKELEGKNVSASSVAVTQPSTQSTSAQLTTLSHGPSSLQRATRPSALRSTTYVVSSNTSPPQRNRSAMKQAPPDPALDTRKAPPPESSDTKFTNMRASLIAQMNANEKRHVEANALLLQTLAGIQAQLLAVQQQNIELNSRASASTSSLSTSAEAPSFTTPTRKSMKSKTMQQRSPPVHPSATSDATKRCKLATTNRYEMLTPDEGDEEVYFYDEATDMSFDDTVTRVEGLSLEQQQQQQPPASGSNGAGKMQ